MDNAKKRLNYIELRQIVESANSRNKEYSQRIDDCEERIQRLTEENERLRVRTYNIEKRLKVIDTMEQSIKTLDNMLHDVQERMQSKVIHTTNNSSRVISSSNNRPANQPSYVQKQTRSNSNVSVSPRKTDSSVINQADQNKCRVLINEYNIHSPSDFAKRYNAVSVGLTNYSRIRRGENVAAEFERGEGAFWYCKFSNYEVIVPKKDELNLSVNRDKFSIVYKFDSTNTSNGKYRINQIALLEQVNKGLWRCSKKGKIT